MYKITLSLAAILAVALIGCGSDSDNKDTEQVAEKKLTRIATVPTGAEVTGIEVNSDGELFFNAQHPHKKDEYTEGVIPAFVGYVKGLNINTFNGKSVAVPTGSDINNTQVAEGEYVKLGNANDLINGGTEVLGGIYDINGKLLYVSNDVDYNAFVKVNDTSAYLYTAWEGAGIKGASSISRLKLNKVDGQWTSDLDNSKMIDLSSINGGWILCFGHTTPWKTELLAEEYYYIDTGKWNHPGHFDGDYTPYYIPGSTNITYHIPETMKDYLAGTFPNPYDYGYQIEMTNLTDEDPKLVKHYTMGRYSHENGVIMADNKTVYQSDDDSGAYGGTGGVLFKFVADKENDLSAGTLYASKLVQYGGTNSENASFNVKWIELGKSNNTTIKGWIDEYAAITDADYVAGQTNYISDADINNWAEGKLKQDINGDGTVGSYPDDRPAFLESRKAAAALGATYEWNKLEGITADSNSLYIAVSDIGYSMSSTWGDVSWDLNATGDRVKTGVSGGDMTVDDEHCGAVYQAKIDANYNLTQITPALVGETVESGCHQDKIANPDNIFAFSDNKVLIGEDSGNHGVDMLWLWGN